MIRENRKKIEGVTLQSFEEKRSIMAWCFQLSPQNKGLNKGGKQPESNQKGLTWGSVFNKIGASFR
ncbi:MAG: hypothetical protein H6Q42_900 [Deltaproteobacteria bacterium]|nr:hypothetical protein [Deltaproteobacteria bacterium]